MLWFQRKYTHDEVQSLVESIKDFKLGAVDTAFSRFADVVFASWAEQNEGFFGKFKKDAVSALVQRIDRFNAGAVDRPLSNHIKQVYEAWLTRHS